MQMAVWMLPTCIRCLQLVENYSSNFFFFLSQYSVFVMKEDNVKLWMFYSFPSASLKYYETLCLDSHCRPVLPVAALPVGYRLSLSYNDFRYTCNCTKIVAGATFTVLSWTGMLYLCHWCFVIICMYSTLHKWLLWSFSGPTRHHKEQQSRENCFP